MRTSRPIGLAFAVLLTAAGSAVAQTTGGTATTAQDSATRRGLQAPRSTELVFERETFAYPEYVRRNPFVPLVADQGGPRYEQMQLRGIIFSDAPGGSVALLGLGTPGDQAGNGSEVDATGQSRRIRAGESWGNVRVLEIRRTEILVQVEEFGLTEERIMRLPTRGQGD